MKNIKVIMQYEGTRYQGWQKQENTENTLQGKLETLLFKMTGEQVKVFASGRTDAGVHAKGQVVNFHIDTEKTPAEIMEYINFYLPEDVAVIACKEVDERFHSRLLAVEKEYEYRVMNTSVPHVFDRRYVHVVPEHLEVDAMQKAAGYLSGTHDYKAFTSNRRSKKSTVRTVKEIRIEPMGDEIRFTFHGSGFLYHMVRIMVGTLLEVGRGARKPEEMKEILESGDRARAGELVPAQGLCLVKVKY